MDAEVISRIVQAVQHEPRVLTVLGASPLAVVPEGYKIESLKCHLLEPEVLSQRVTVLTAAAFLAYWERFRTEESVVFADERTAEYRALLDYHHPDGTPARLGHQALYKAPKSKEWETWAGMSGKKMDQQSFAEFIEENYVDVHDPSHADMIQISMNLQVKKGIAFSQSTRLSDGQVQLTYQEEITGRTETKAGSTTVPEHFTLHLPVFFGGAVFPVKAHLRYRVEGGKLVIGYDLHRPHKVVEAATTQITEQIVKGLTTSPVFLGAP